jgi:hypothetical protein
MWVSTAGITRQRTENGKHFSVCKDIAHGFLYLYRNEDNCKLLFENAKNDHFRMEPEAPNRIPKSYALTSAAFAKLVVDSVR